MEAKFIAMRIVEVFAWLTLVSGVVIIPIWFAAESVPADSDVRLWAIIASIFNGVLGWALLLVFASTAEQINELHHEVTRALKN